MLIFIKYILFTFCQIFSNFNTVDPLLGELQTETYNFCINGEGEILRYDQTKGDKVYLYKCTQKGEKLDSLHFSYRLLNSFCQNTRKRKSVSKRTREIIPYSFVRIKDREQCIILFEFVAKSVPNKEFGMILTNKNQHVITTSHLYGTEYGVKQEAYNLLLKDKDVIIEEFIHSHEGEPLPSPSDENIAKHWKETYPKRVLSNKIYYIKDGQYHEY